VSAFTIPGLRTARSLARHAGKTPTQLKTELDQLADDNTVLTGDREDLLCALTRAGLRIGDLEAELAAAVAEVRQLQRRTIRDAASLQRLRQAVRQKWNVQVVDAEVARPFAPDCVLPYVSPVPVAVHRADDEPVTFAEYSLPQQRRAS
jgi:hypothetical protein